MEFWLTILGGFFGLIGAFAGAWLAHLYEKRILKEKEKRDTTVALYMEFHNQEMLNTRIIARRVLTDNLERERPLSLDEMYSDLEKEEWHAVSILITFFEKMGVLLRNDYLDDRLTRQLFENDFKWWYEHYLKRIVKQDNKLKDPWSQNIEFANLWFQNNQ